MFHAYKLYEFTLMHVELMFLHLIEFWWKGREEEGSNKFLGQMLYVRTKSSCSTRFLNGVATFVITDDLIGK